MGQKEKLIQKLKSRPKDFTFEEAESLLGHFSYSLFLFCEQHAAYDFPFR